MGSSQVEFYAKSEMCSMYVLLIRCKLKFRRAFVFAALLVGDVMILQLCTNHYYAVMVCAVVCVDVSRCFATV